MNSLENTISKRLSAIHDRESYAVLKEFVKSALSILKAKLVTGEPLPKAEFEEIIINEGGYTGLNTEVRDDLLQFAERHLLELESLPQYSRALESLMRSDLLERHIERVAARQGRQMQKSDIEHFVENSLVKKFLFRLIGDTNSLEFDESRFDRLYAALEDSLTTEEIQYVLLAPLRNFECTTERIQLSDGLEIRRLSKEELNGILKGNRFGLVPMFELLMIKFGVVCRFNVPIDAQMDFTQDVRERITLVITALRLWKAGAVGIVAHFLLPESIWRTGAQGIISPTAPRFLVGTPYQLAESEVPGFLGLFRNLRESLTLAKSEQATLAKVAIRRFNASMEELEPEDRLIDEIIAFENLLLPERDELSLRLAIRAANLLTNAVDDRRSIFAFFRKAYDVRSDIVHGIARPTTIKVDDTRSLSLGQLVEQLEDYLRRAILELDRRQESKSKQQILDELTDPF